MRTTAAFLTAVLAASASAHVPAPSPPSNTPLPATDLHTFPPPTWVENLAVRHNGGILTSLLSNATVTYLAPPFTHATTIAHIPSSLLVAGIAELKPDLFGVLAGNASLSDPAAGAPGTYSLWTLDLSGCGARPAAHGVGAPVLRKVADLPELVFGNGLTRLNDAYALAADSSRGVVLRVALTDGASSVAIDDPLLKRPGGAAIPVGVNGVRVGGDAGTVYFTNTATGVVGRVGVGRDGTATGPAVNITRIDGGVDDFAVGKDGVLYVSGAAANTVVMVGPTGEQRVLAGGGNDSVLAQPTSVQLGRGRKEGESLFVTTAGRLVEADGGVDFVGGQLAEVKL